MSSGDLFSTKGIDIPKEPLLNIGSQLKNYQYDKCQSIPRHDLSRAIINEKTLYLIEKGWVFWYAPQNVTSTHDKSFMTDPDSEWRTGYQYEAAYEMLKQSEIPNLFNRGDV